MFILGIFKERKTQKHNHKIGKIVNEIINNALSKI
jgi:hypothetical protein